MAEVINKPQIVSNCSDFDYFPTRNWQGSGLYDNIAIEQTKYVRTSFVALRFLGEFYKGTSCIVLLFPIELR